MNNIREFVIACSWQVRGVIRIRAKDLPSAIAVARRRNIPAGEGEYIDHSFRVGVKPVVNYKGNV